MDTFSKGLILGALFGLMIGYSTFSPNYQLVAYCALQGGAIGWLADIVLQFIKK